MPQTFNPAVMTDGGAALLTKAQAGQCSIEFTRIVTGDGTYTASEETVEALEKRTALKSEKNSYAISSCEVYSEKAVKVTALISNVDPDTGESVVTTGYYINEVGLYGKEKGGSSSTEVLYSLAIVASTPGDYMPAYNGYDPAQITQDYYATVDNSANVTIDSSGAYVSAEMFDSLFPDSAGAHNAICRGKYLGTEVTSGQWSQIKAGTFKDLYPGDYWTLNGYDFLVADLDYRYRCGDTQCTDHHILILPRGRLYTGAMNDSNTNEGGYVGSLMYQEGLDEALGIIEAAFGAEHILEQSVYLTNATTDGRPSGGAWSNEKIVLPNEEMIYGCPIRQQMSYGGTAVTNHTIDKSQLAVCRYDPEARLAMGTGAGSNKTSRYAYWLRDIASASTFCLVSANGLANSTNASTSYGVRPAFAIYQS